MQCIILCITIAISFRIKVLLDDCGNVNRHFIDTFASSSSFIRPMVLDLKESIVQSNNIDDLRNHYFLNPINQGEQMGSLAKRGLTATNPLSTYSEIAAAVTHYTDYVMFAVIACPILLFEEPILDVVRAATSYRAFATLHRDLVSLLVIKLNSSN